MRELGCRGLIEAEALAGGVDRMLIDAVQKTDRTSRHPGQGAQAGTALAATTRTNRNATPRRARTKRASDDFTGRAC
jgi:hypothetical protein